MGCGLGRGRDGGEADKTKYTLLPTQIDNETNVIIERHESHLDLANNNVPASEMISTIGLMNMPPPETHRIQVTSTFISTSKVPDLFVLDIE